MIARKGASPEARSRALLLDVVRWAASQFHRCLLDDPAAEAAGAYLDERGLTAETVRRFELGFAPLAGDWLVQRAREAGIDFELLEKVGLVAPRQSGQGHYDRFRDRVMFPVRDARGQAVGGGRRRSIRRGTAGGERGAGVIPKKNRKGARLTRLEAPRRRRVGDVATSPTMAPSSRARRWCRTAESGAAAGLPTLGAARAAGRPGEVGAPSRGASAGHVVRGRTPGRVTAPVLPP